MNNFTTNKKSEASQKIVPIKEIRDGVVILNDNSMRMILMTSSLNFALKSNEEQRAIIFQYQNFLNSLDFHIQFFIQSRALNIENYIKSLDEKEKQQTDELLKIQTKEYIDFIREFVISTKIVNKTFYVVVPYSPPLIKIQNNILFDFINKILKKETKPRATPQEEFEKNKIQLQQRTDTIIQGLSRAGIRSIPLNTEELIELFYGLYNPGEKERGTIPKLDIS